MAQIFISYAREDFAHARALYQRLKDAGFTPWMDKVDLRAGQPWRGAIERAIQRADFFIICLSNHSVKKRGFLQREIKIALDLWQEKLARDIYLLPVMLEYVPHDELPDEVREIQWVELYQDDGWAYLLESLEYGIEQRGIKRGSPPAAQSEAKAEPPKGGSASSPASITPLSSRPALSLLTYDFATVTLDARGEVIERGREQAKYFIEDPSGLKLEMIFVPGGSFYMGTSSADAAEVKKEYARYGWGEGWVKTEMPQHEVNLPDFFLGKFQVTQAQWKAVARLPKSNLDLELDPSNFKGDTLPVEQVSWDEAQEFCARLAKKTGKAYRLPSEAEWEYACRAGTMTPFAFGETITPEFVNYNGDYPYANAKKGAYRKQATPVGSLGVANAFGLFDMHGNVWEWCQDRWHENYNDAPDDGSAWENGDSEYRVLRGGSWNYNSNNCRAANRDSHAPGLRLNYIGFRVVVSARTS